MNRASYAMLLGMLVAAYIVMIKFLERPPGAEIFVALIAVPRLHDIGKSGWWLLTLLVGEVIAVIIGWPYGTDGILIASGLFVLFSLALLVILAFVPGQTSANEWGEPPEPGIRLGRLRASS
jgi:uncharacterized membrane protein YhaH (DUF805 family)